MFNGRKLRAKMVENNITNTDLAEFLDINPATLYRKSVGISDFTRSEIQKISEYLALSMQEVKDIFFAEELA